MISIIVPVYNAEKWLERCINSVLSQSYTDWELLLIDDGSIDRSGEICDRYAESDSRILVFHKSNGGVTQARAMGVNKSKSDYIYFIDADDYIAPDCIESITTEIDDNTDLIVFETDAEVSLTPEQYACELFQFKYWNVWGKLYRKKLFDEYTLSISNKFKVGEDFLMQLRLLCKVRGEIRLSSKKKYCYNTNNPNSVQISHKKSYEYERDMVFEVSDILSRFPKNEDVSNALFHWKMTYLNGMIGLRYSIDFSDDWIQELVVESKSRKLSAKEIIAIKAINNPLLRIVPIIDKQLHIFARRCIHLIRR